jgi:flagellar motor switch protein FliM
MTDTPKRNSPAPGTERASPQALDPRTLGRPVHLLPRFAEQLGEALGELFRAHNRRYRAEFQVGEISIKPLAPAALGGRWMAADGMHGRVAAQAERALVLALMAQRYGDSPKAAEQAPPETATEERLLRLLSQQALTRALALIDTAENLALQATQQPQLSAGSWFVQVPVREERLGLQSHLLLALDPLYIDRLLKRLGETLPARQDKTPKPDPQQLAKRLTLKLEARLLEQTLPLGELLALRPGDLIPVRLKTTDVLVDGSHLFTASVAEHQGKLCLTSFADAE